MRRGAMWVLTVLTVLNFFNYVDRWVLPAVLPQIKTVAGFAGHSDATFGFLQTAFLLTYMIFSPLGGALGDRIPRKYIVAAGVAIWSLATVWSGLARNFNELLAARSLIGFGEAGYAAVAPAIISDLFAKDKRARMLSVFYTATPAGSALGFVIGGVVAKHYSWRHAFWVAGAPGLLFALFAMFMMEPARGAQDEVRAADESKQSLWESAASLLRNQRWVYCTAGFTLMTFAFGALAFWMPTYFQEVRGLDEQQAGLFFGGLSTLAGLIGTAAGGWLGDAWARRDKGAYMRLSGLGLIVGVPFAMAGPYVPNLWACLGILFVAEFFLFLNTGPLNAALVSSTTARTREVAVGLNILCIHLFGDAFSPALIGGVRDLLVGRGMDAHAARTLSIASSSLPMLIGGAVLVYGAKFFRRENGQAAAAGALGA
jgi:MFS family permease